MIVADVDGNFIDALYVAGALLPTHYPLGHCENNLFLLYKDFVVGLHSNDSYFARSLYMYSRLK